MAYSTQRESETGYDTEGECRYCVKNDQTRSAPGGIARQQHYLAFTATYGLDAMEAHLRIWVSRWYDDSQEAHERIQGHMAWLRDEVQTFSGNVDPQTGAPMHWADARRMFAQQALAIAQAARERAPQRHTAPETAKTVYPMTPVADVVSRKAPMSPQREEEISMDHDDYWPELEDETLLPVPDEKEEF